MASGSNNLTTYYAKRIIGDTNAQSSATALLQTGTGIATDLWILGNTVHDTYGIRYLYDGDNSHDKLQAWGGGSAATAWVQLDTGDVYILGKVGIGYDPNTSGNTHKLYVNGTGYFSNDLITAMGLFASAIELSSATPYIDFHFDSSSADYTSRIIESASGYLQIPGSFGVGGQNTSYKFYVNGTSYLNGSSTVNGTLTANGTITANGGYLKSTLNSNTITIGSQNTSFCHIESSANIPFWFNRSIYMAQGTTIGAAGTQYRPFQLYLGRHSTTAGNALNTANPLIEFSNSDRSQYCQLMYDDHDSLVAPDSLTLVGNQDGIFFICKNGPIWVQGGSNAGGNQNRLTTSAGMPGNMQYNTSRRGTQIYANGIAFCDPYNGNSNNDAGWIRHQETTANSGELEIAVGDDGDETVVVRQYNTSNGVQRTLTLLSKDGYAFFPSYINIGGNENNASSPPRVWGTNGSDNYLRSYQTAYLNVNSAEYARSYLDNRGSVSGSSHAEALKAYFNSNKASEPRNCLVAHYSSAHSNGSLCMGYFLSGYDSGPYGGFFVCHYNTPRYVGISGGTYTQHDIMTNQNYTSWTVTKTGSGASGTWGINITGSANYVKLYEARGSTTNLNKAANYVAAGAMFHLVASSSTTTGKTSFDANILQMNWDNNGGYDSQLGISTSGSRMQIRSQASAGTDWREVVTTAAATKTGGATQPVYISNTGQATACTTYANASVSNAGYLRDKTNGTASYLDYGRSGITAGSGFTWIGVWDGYTLAPASKAAMFQAIRDNGGDSRWYVKDADNNHLTHTNEFNFVGSSFSGTVYFNYRTSGGGNGSISQYIFSTGNGTSTSRAGISCGSLGCSSLSCSSITGTSATLHIYNGASWRLSLQSDGNLVWYNSSGSAKWSTGTSSYHTKQNIRSIDDYDLNNFMRIHTVSFKYRPEMHFADTNKQYGVIAEELLSIYPNLVDVPENYVDSKFDINKGLEQPLIKVKYEQFIPLLIKMVQNQQRQIEKLEKQIKCD